MIQTNSALATSALAPSSSPSTASPGKARLMASRTKRSTSRSIAVTSSWRPFAGNSAARPKALCARRPASAARRRQKSRRVFSVMGESMLERDAIRTIGVNPRRCNAGQEPFGLSLSKPATTPFGLRYRSPRGTGPRLRYLSPALRYLRANGSGITPPPPAHSSTSASSPRRCVWLPSHRPASAAVRSRRGRWRRRPPSRAETPR